jgi:hypothetical protein
LNDAKAGLHFCSIMLSSFLVIFPFIAGINALNDWTVVCTGGECSYGA